MLKSTIKRSIPKASTEQGDLTYTFKDMKVCLEDGVDYFLGQDGSLEIQFKKQFSRIRLLLPESIDLRECVGLTIEMDSKDTYLDVCFFDERILTDKNCPTAYGRWGVYVNGSSAYQSFPVTGETYGIGFEVGAEDADYSRYKFKIDRMTFHMASGSIAEIPKDIAPDVTEDMTLLNTYGTVFDKIGALVSLDFLENPATLKAYKEHFNSVTMAYHIDYMFTTPVTFITVEEAKKLGYSIPADYTDAMVPKFDFSTMDKILKICAENGLSWRAQASTCNGQIPKWFFSEGYKEDGAYVSPKTMNARNEYYIRTMMEHVYNSEYGYVVYAWDLVNEYYHTKESDWVNVYGQYTLRPDNMKRLYEAAADVLVSHGIRDEVSLVMNEYNTYMVYNGENVPETLIAIADYINSDVRAVDTIGMQGTLDSEASAVAFKNAAKKYLAAGYEVSVTELSIELVKKTPEHIRQQAMVAGQVFKELLMLKKSGANINVLSISGPSESTSIPPEYSSYLFLFYGRPKDCVYSMLQSYIDVIGKEPYTPPKPDANGDLTYTFYDMDYLKMYNFADSYNYKQEADGSVQIRYSGPYESFRLGLPNGVDMSKCTGVTFRIKPDKSGVALFFLNEDALFNHWVEAVYSDYECRGDGIIEYTITPDINEMIYGIDISSLNKTAGFSEYSTVLYSVTFHME